MAGRVKTFNETLDGLQAKLKGVWEALSPRPTPPPQPPAIIPPQEVIRAEVEVIPKVQTPLELLSGIHDALKRQQAQGEVIPFELSVTSQTQEAEARDPVTRELKDLLTLSLENSGPNTAYIRVNYPSAGAIPLPKNRTIELDFTKAKKRIERFFYYCKAGQTASVTGAGKW